MKQYRKSEMKQYKYFPHIGLTLSTASNNENNSTILTGHRLTSKQVDKENKLRNGESIYSKRRDRRVIHYNLYLKLNSSLQTD